jgi:DNA-binding transcriptional ArsR family regulator
MAKHPLTPELLILVADRFKALGEPARLRILNSLRAGEKTVTDLVYETELGQANVSKHLHLLYAAGLVVRRKAGLFVYYAIADDRVYRLCDLMCDQLQAESRSRQRVVA